MSAQDILKKIGLNEKETRVYLALLRAGRSTPSSLSKITKINRATVYNIIQNLIGRSMITEDLAGKTMHVVPLPLENLQKMTEKPRRELKEKEELIKKAMAELSLIRSDEKYPVPKIRFVEESKLEDCLYENFEKWNEATHTSNSEWWGFQDHSLVENYEKWILWTWQHKGYQDPRIRAKLLSNDSNIEQKMGKRFPRTKRGIRFVSGMNFTSTIWVAGDYLIMIMTREHPFYLVEINDALLAHNMREVFRKFWEMLDRK